MQPGLVSSLSCLDNEVVHLADGIVGRFLSLKLDESVAPRLKIAINGDFR